MSLIKRPAETDEIPEWIVQRLRTVVRSTLNWISNHNPEAADKKYAGYCDTACMDLVSRIHRIFPNAGVHVTTQHGELKHSPKIRSCFWPLQHTWIKVNIDDYVIYVDPTSGQFEDMLPDIPSIYISTTPPPWYLNDRDNPIFRHGWIHSINEKVRVMVKAQDDEDEFYSYKAGIVEILMYDVWGTFCEFYRKITRRN